MEDIERLQIEKNIVKLNAETEHLLANTKAIGFRIILQSIATGAGVVGVLIGAAKTFGG